jgi:hypothetical protein
MSYFYDNTAAPAHMPVLPPPPKSVEIHPGLENSLEVLKRLVRDVTPDEVLDSIEATVAAMPNESVQYAITMSCQGASDGGTT